MWGWGLARFGVLGANEEGLVAEEATNVVNVEDEGLLLDVDGPGAEAEVPPLMYQPVPAMVSGLTGKHVVQVLAPYNSRFVTDTMMMTMATAVTARGEH